MQLGTREKVRQKGRDRDSGGSGCDGVFLQMYLNIYHLLHNVKGFLISRDMDTRANITSNK